MARRVPRAALIACAIAAVSTLAAWPAAGAEGARSPVLVSYSFDDDEIATGPDTFRIYQQSKGSVRLTSALRYSGYRSVELREVAGDGAFPELQGYFSLRRSGKLFAHFSIMSADPAQTFNLALAGPRWFTLSKDGIAFWMLSRNGFLYHYSDSMPKRLVPMLAFVWYTVDVAYDIGAGHYDLVVRQEGVADPVVSLAAQINAPNAPGSGVDKFSFIGDTGEDTSSVVYYVDDVILSADRPVSQQAFVAPGRRKLFVDAWYDYQKLARSRPVCLPAIAPGDLGFDATALEEIEKSGELPRLALVLQGQARQTAQGLDALSPQSQLLMRSSLSWREGCAALEAGRALEALAHFERASSLAPGGRLQSLSAALALAALSRWKDADARIAAVESEMHGDPRLAAASAIVGVARGDLDRAEEILASQEAGDPQSPFAPRLAEQSFFVLLWKSAWDRAEELARRMAESAEARGASAALWQERVGDAAFLGGDAGRALVWYEKSLAGQPGSALLAVKLSDVHFKLGDLEKERRFREAVYGSLKE